MQVLLLVDRIWYAISCANSTFSNFNSIGTLVVLRISEMIFSKAVISGRYYTSGILIAYFKTKLVPNRTISIF